MKDEPEKPFKDGGRGDTVQLHRDGDGRSQHVRLRFNVLDGFPKIDVRVVL